MSHDLDAQLAALDRLVVIAAGDTGQCRRVANFLLAWWNAASCGGFDLTDLWAVDRAIADDMILVMRLVARSHQYPGHYGYSQAFEQMIANWRPALLSAGA